MSGTIGEKMQPNDAACRMCTRHLEQLCYRRAWWFRAFRELLALGVGLFARALRVRPSGEGMRTAFCRDCLRFRKNAVKRVSPAFRWLDSYVNPVFNRLRDSLLTPEELERARALARENEAQPDEPGDIDHRLERTA